VTPRYSIVDAGDRSTDTWNRGSGPTGRPRVIACEPARLAAKITRRIDRGRLQRWPGDDLLIVLDERSGEVERQDRYCCAAAFTRASS